MQRAEKEKYVFLQFCGERNRDFLLGNKKMCLEEFDRLSYIVDFLGYQHYHIALWNEYEEYFRQQFVFLQQLIDDEDYYFDMDYEADLYESWLIDFIKNISDIEVRKKCKRLIKRSYKKRGYEYPKKIELL
ncbi:MAG: hypothetical protein ACOX8M_01815 [Marvinbryantia sp.]|jgi:hypothetical protein